MTAFRLLKHGWIFFVLLLVAGCSGSGCSSCSGVAPLPNGFDPTRRIENAAAIRLTDQGRKFLQENLGTIAGKLMGDSTGVMTFAAPASTGSYSVLGFPLINYTVCPDGAKPDATPPECMVEANLAAATLYVDADQPHNVHIYGHLPIRIQNLPVTLSWLFIPSHTVVVANDDSNVCPPAQQGFASVGISVSVSLEIDQDPAHGRYGYTRVQIAEISGTNQDFSDAIHFCGTGIDDVILNGLRGVLVPMIMDSLTGTIKTSIENMLCQKTNPAVDPPCPTGTTDVDGICRYGADATFACSSVPLGMEGTIGVGELMAAFSPGTQAAFDILLAAGGHSLRTDGSGYFWGDANPFFKDGVTLSGGLTLSMYGGSEPRPVSRCVPEAQVALPANLPVPALLNPTEAAGDNVPGWPANTPADFPGAHVGFALSESYANYALAQIYNSGALCLEITGEKIALLNTNLIALALGAPSLAELGRMKATAQVAVVVRPQTPPHITFGNGTSLDTDPLIRLVAKEMSFDFYVWSLDRFVRAATATADLDVPLNLSMTPDGLQPTLDSINLANAVITNSQLLRENPELIASTIQSLVGQMVGGALGSLSAFDVSGPLAPFGLRLVIPASAEGQGSPGLRKLAEGNENFLGIFASFEALPSNRALEVDTGAELGDLDLGTFGPTIEASKATGGYQADAPTMSLRLSSPLDDGSHAVEWQYQVDSQPWHPFHRERQVTLRGMWLLEQGSHVVRARARLVGEPMSLDRTPAEVMLRVDSEPPVLRVQELEQGQILVRAADYVSSDEQLLVRTRFGTRKGNDVRFGEWSDWLPQLEQDPTRPAGSNVLEAQAKDEEGNIGTVTQALLSDPKAMDSASAACSIQARAGSRSGRSALLALLLGAVGALRRRRAARSVGARAAVAVVLGAAVVCGAGLSAGCSCTSDTSDGGCRGRGDCKALSPGLIGAYTSVAVAPDGSLWVAGYLEANWELGYPWGDLVVGRYDGTEVQWSIVDGVPSDPPIETDLYDSQGFRGGQVAPGDDVGLWTSIAFDPNGVMAVAYYDATHRQLKYASSQGGSWSIAVVDRRSFGDEGRYAKLLFVNGLPVVSYSFVETAQSNTVRSGVRVATGSSSSAANAQWGFEEVYVDPATPCNAAYCTGEAKCAAATGSCTVPITGCATDCGDGLACLEADGGPACQAVWSFKALESYPDAAGPYVSVAAQPGGGIGLAFYDRAHGNVLVATKSNGNWTTIVADGEQDGVDTGDRGAGLSLAIDGSGNYHLAYLDSLSGELLYSQVKGGKTPGTAEVVDDGYTVQGQPFADRHHRIGLDSNIALGNNGEVRISYQDASVGTLRFARGVPSAGAHQWTQTVVAQDGFAGAFSHQIVVGNVPLIASFWRVAAPSPVGNVRLVAQP